MRSRRAIGWLALALVLLAGCDDTPAKPVPPPPPTDAASTVDALVRIYESRSAAEFAALIADDYVFVRTEPDPSTGESHWDAVEERSLHARMLSPGSIAPGDIPLADDLWVGALDVTMTPIIDFAERRDLYTDRNPQGALDSLRWIARGATYRTQAFFDLAGDTDYLVDCRAYLVVLEDRGKRVGDAGKFLLYRWEDMEPIGFKGNAVRPLTWGPMKSLYSRRTGATSSPAAAIEALREAYRSQNLAAFTRLLSADFRFLPQGLISGETEWDLTEELVLHRRMFDPLDTPLGEPPVPAEHVVQGISIALSAQTSFVQRPDLYTTATPPGPLDPDSWIARSATYGTDVFFDLAGLTDYRVLGQAEFIVLEDRRRDGADPRRFVLYRWEDRRPPPGGKALDLPSGIEAATWSAMKALYRVPQVPAGASGLIRRLATAYQNRQLNDFTALLAPDFIFVLDEPLQDTGETHWDRTTEERIHRRMFEPQNIPPGDPPLPPEHWVQYLSVALTPQTVFSERTDLYTTANPPGPLDPARWIAGGATYETYVYWNLQGETDYLVQGLAHFTVIEDRARPAGDPGRWRLYRWEDLGARFSKRQEATWSQLKGLYRR